MVTRPPGYASDFIILMILCKIESHHHYVSQYFNLMKQEYPSKISLFFVTTKGDGEFGIHSMRSKPHQKDSGMMSLMLHTYN